MAAKVKWDREAWWVFTHYHGKRTKKRVGSTKTDKRQAEEIAKKINAALALGIFQAESQREQPLPCNAELRRWHMTYTPTMKRSYEILTKGHIENHLIPFFGDRDLREIREADLLEFARKLLDAGKKPKTVRNSLSTLRRVFTLAQREGRVDRNPAARIGELLRRVDQRYAIEAESVETWTPQEISTLLEVASEYEPRFAPALAVLFYTGLRRGELLGLKWEDVDFERRRIHVRRSNVKGQIGTPKSGRSRFVVLADSLASILLDVLAERRRESLTRGWTAVPEWVFPSETGGFLDPDNFERTWRRVRRRAQRHGVRPLKLHCARHTFASLALAAGKSVRWVADQLGHADPALTLRVYAHAIPDEETDLSFLNFDVPGRPYTAPLDEGVLEDENTPAISGPRHWENLARPVRLERTTFRSAT